MSDPNLFIVGAPKSGTTALAEYLAERNDVFFVRPKETLFWCDDLGVEPHALRVSSLSEYSDLFRMADPLRHRIRAEGTTSYLRSRKAIMECVARYDGSKFVAILRNPVEVAYAFHMEQVYTGLEKELDFRLAWEDQSRREAEWDAREDDRPDSLLYRRIASFADQIAFFFSHVPPDRRRVFLFDDLRSNPRRLWLSLLEFLGLPDDGRISFPPRNEAHKQRFPRLSSLLLSPPNQVAPFVKSIRLKLIKSNWPAVSRAKGFLNVKVPRKDLPIELRAEMVRSFRGEIDRLEIMLKRDLSAWKAESSLC